MRSFVPTLVAVVATAWGSWGCNLSTSCGETLTDVTSSDGGVMRCAQAEDCPRSSSVSVCTESRALSGSCMACTDTRCVLHETVPCD